MSIQALRERLAASNKAARNLLENKGSTPWSKEDQATFDNHMDESSRTESQIAATEKLNAKDREDNFKDIEQADKSKKGAEKFAGLNLFYRKKQADMSAEELQTVRNTMSTTTGSQGGFTVQTEVAKSVVDAIKDFGGMRRVADSTSTDQGNDMNYPTSDGTSELGEIIAQNGQANSADVVFGSLPLNTFKFGSKIITIPIELLQDTSVDIMALVNKRVRQRIGRIMNVKHTNGTGTAEPYGLTATATVGKTGTTGQTTTIIYDDLVSLIDSLDIGYLDQGLPLQFLTSQALRATLRKIKDTSGRPIWTPNYDAGLAGGFVDQLLGYDLMINNDMPAPAANAKSLSFGQHKAYMIRDAMDVIMFRFDDSVYMSKGQVGFLAWARSGGNLLDVNAVKLYQHSAT